MSLAGTQRIAHRDRRRWLVRRHLTAMAGPGVLLEHLLDGLVEVLLPLFRALLRSRSLLAAARQTIERVFASMIPTTRVPTGTRSTAPSSAPPEGTAQRLS